MYDSLKRPVPLIRYLPDPKTDLASLVLRAVLAVIFIAAGSDKIFTAGNDLGSNWMTPLLNPPRGSDIQSPLLSALQAGVAWGEFLGGVALALGLFTRIAAAAMLLIQVSVIYLIYFDNVFSPIKDGGPQYNFSLIGMCLALVFLGGGYFAVDRLLPQGKKEGTEAKPMSEPVGAGLASTPNR